MKRQLFVFCFASLLASYGFGEAPEVSDPEERLIPGFDEPGEFPTGVTGANINLIPQAGSGIDGLNEDVFRAEFPAMGPIAWTSPRMNAGDIAVSIGPAFPNNPLSYPSGDDGFQNNFQAMNSGEELDPDTTDLTTLAWRMTEQTGAHFAFTRHNGTDLGYVLNDDTPVGTMHGIAYVSGGGTRQGWGFNMNDGVFSNGGIGATEIHTAHGGFADGAHEAVFNIATVFFPYEAGWTGAWVVGAEEGEAFFNGGSEDLISEDVLWEEGIASVQLPEVNSASDGMLFVAPSNGDSSSRIASGFPNEAGGWSVTVRFDDDEDTTGETFIETGDDFQFLYVPYSASDLVGAHVDGETGNAINSAGDSQFSLTRQESGQYALSVFEADGQTKKDGDSGMLMLSVADSIGDTGLGSRAFMSYEFDVASGDFMIESRELVGIDPGNGFDAYGNVFSGSDSDFYFAWVDFTNPLNLDSNPSVPGDFDGSGVFDITDLDTLTEAVKTNSVDAIFDLDSNGTVDAADVNFWVANIKGTWSGDANLDGEYNSADLVAVFSAGTYEDATPMNSTWATGDWNADGDFDSSDLVAAFSDGGYENGPRTATAAVPEPQGLTLLLVGALPLCFIRRRQGR